MTWVQAQTENQVTAVTAHGAVRKVLVVDDSRVQLRIISAILRKMGYDVKEAESGEDALDICLVEKPDLVISDWMMPGMTGVELCKKLRQTDFSHYNYFILLTAKSAKDEIAHGLDAGADDFLSKPVDAGELRARINAGARVLSMQQELSQKNRVISDTLAQLEAVHAGIDQDLRQARTIQQSLVPTRRAEWGRARIGLLLKPCGHVGGDLVGMFRADEDNIGFYSLDVSGHGITSALITARVAGYLSDEFPDHNIALNHNSDDGPVIRPPDEVALQLSRRMSMDKGIIEYLTMNFATADLRSGLIRFVQAGHPPPLVLRANGKASFVGSGGTPIGLVSDPKFHQNCVTLEPGDKFLLYSDGITELEKADGSVLDEEGLLRLVKDIPPTFTSTEFLDDLYWRLQSLKSDNPKGEDDISALLFEMTE